MIHRYIPTNFTIPIGNWYSEIFIYISCPDRSQRFVWKNEIWSAQKYFSKIRSIPLASLK